MNNDRQPKHAWPPWLKSLVIGRHPRRTLWRIGGLVVVCFVTFRFVLLPVRVEGESMWPTYRNHRINFINRLAYLRHEPRRGDVVGIRLAGWRVILYINRQLVPEPYVRTPCNWELPPEQLGPDEYFVVGDNRGMAVQDHWLGATSRARIMGKVLL
ncbi:MAG: Signal peptidase I T [Verrucomicrobia bacterium ADurb.Bin118]|nr:MAG: Signal peptidase I T [Verrucomicrobia bacterium ADurb.Bin118]